MVIVLYRGCPMSVLKDSKSYSRLSPYHQLIENQIPKYEKYINYLPNADSVSMIKKKNVNVFSERPLFFVFVFCLVKLR